MAERRSTEGQLDEIVMTPLKPKNGRQIIRIERTTSEKLNSDRVHYVAGGTYMGIIVNRAVNVKPKKTPPHAIRHFIAHVNGANNEIVREVRELRFWFKSSVTEDFMDVIAEDFFKELLNSNNFPKDYMSFVKRLLRLVQSFISVRNLELEIRPFTDDDEPLDVRGQPMGLVSSSTAVRASQFYSSEGELDRQPPSPPAVVTASPQQRQVNGSGGGAGGEVDPVEVSTTKKTKKKRKSRPVSDDVVELTSSLAAANINGTVAEVAVENEDFIVHEEIIRSEVVTTGYRGNEAYAAELGLNTAAGQNEDDVEEIVTLRHEPRRGGTGPRRVTSADRVSSSSGNMASKRDKIIGTLEDAFPTALSVDDLVRITRVKRPDVEMLIADLCQVRALAEVEHGMWIRAHPSSGLRSDETNTTSRRSKRASREHLVEQDPRQHDFRMVAHVPSLKAGDQPTVAIVTSLYCEKLAVDAMIDFKTTYIRCKKGGEGQVYTVGKIGKHRVVSTKLSRVGPETGSSVATGNTITRLLGTFNRVEHVFIVGVAGGVACDDDDARHVRLGDVIVSLSDGVRPLYVQMTSPTNGDADHSVRGAVGLSNGDGTTSKSWVASDSYLHGVFNKLKRAPKGFYKRFDQYINEGLVELEPCVDVVDSSTLPSPSQSAFVRPSADTDHPYIRVGSSEIELPVDGHPPVLPGSIRERRGPDRPVVHSGTVGAGRSLVRDPEARRRALDELDVRAVDVGFPAVFESLVGNRKESFGVVRGSADYADGGGAKGRLAWRPYAALTAAAVMKSIVLAIPAPADDDDEVDHNGV